MIAPPARAELRRGARRLPGALLAAALAAAPASAAGPSPAAPAGPPDARARSVLARAERTEVRLGEPFAYEIEIRHPADEAIALAPTLDAPPFRGTGGGCRREARGGEARTTCAIRLALLDLGPHDVPELSLSVRTPEGETTLSVPGPRVTGLGVIDPAAPAESLALRPLAPPVPLLVPTLRPLGWALGAAGLALLLLLARRLRRARARAAAGPPPPEPPDERLLRRLDALEARALPARGLAREHFFELSAAVREWVGGVAGLNAVELTTAELAGRLAAAGDPRLDAAAVVSFCEAADLVKFARGEASPERCAAALAWARGLPARAAAGEAAARAVAARDAAADAGGGRP